MVRRSGRSKGCATCRKRKIRCDETLPECSQCLKGGRNCPGAVSGMVFLAAATSRSSSGPRAPTRETVSAEGIPQSKLLDEGSSFTGTSLPRQGVIRINSTIKGTGAGSSGKNAESEKDYSEFFSKVELQQNQHGQAELSASQGQSRISRSPNIIGNDGALTEQMLPQFIDFFANDLTVEEDIQLWAHMLPHMASCGLFSSAVKLPVTAASCMYYGTLTKQKSAIMEAYKLYGSSMEEQRKQLQLAARENRVPTAEEICMPIVLSFFEAICSTSAAAWSHHIVAASRLLDIRGAERCSSGVCYQLFQSVRAYMIYPAITSRSPSVFARDDWLKAPFVGRSKSLFDKVMDFLTCLPLVQCQIDGDCSPQILAENRPGGHPLEMRAKQMKLELDDLWAEMRDEAGAQGWRREWFQDRSGFDFDLVHNTNDVVVDARELLGALTVALYKTARILLLSIISQVAPLPLSELQVMSDEMTAHSASIIHMAEFLMDSNVGCALIRFMLPLRVVGVSDHCVSHSRHAVHLLERLRSRCGMGGICEIVLFDIQERRHLRLGSGLGGSRSR